MPGSSLPVVYGRLKGMCPVSLETSLIGRLALNGREARRRRTAAVGCASHPRPAGQAAGASRVTRCDRVARTAGAVAVAVVEHVAMLAMVEHGRILHHLGIPA